MACVRFYWSICLFIILYYWVDWIRWHGTHFFTSNVDLTSDAIMNIIIYTCIESSAKLGNVWWLNKIKHCLVTKPFFGWTPFLMVFDRIWTTSNIWSNIAKKHFVHSNMFDIVKSLNTTSKCLITKECLIVLVAKPFPSGQRLRGWLRSNVHARCVNFKKWGALTWGVNIVKLT